MTQKKKKNSKPWEADDPEGYNFLEEQEGEKKPKDKEPPEDTTDEAEETIEHFVKRNKWLKKFYGEPEAGTQRRGLDKE